MSNNSLKKKKQLLQKLQSYNEAFKLLCSNIKKSLRYKQIVSYNDFDFEYQGEYDFTQEIDKAVKKLNLNTIYIRSKDDHCYYVVDSNVEIGMYEKFSFTLGK